LDDCKSEVARAVRKVSHFISIYDLCYIHYILTWLWLFI
jgi:hypothetical protein